MVGRWQVLALLGWGLLAALAARAHESAAAEEAWTGGLPFLQWNQSACCPFAAPGQTGGRRRLEQCSIGSQCGTEGRIQGGQAACSPRDRQSPMGRVREAGQGQLPEGAQALPAGLGKDREGCTRGRRSTGGCSSSCPGGGLGRKAGHGGCCCCSGWFSLGAASVSHLRGMGLRGGAGHGWSVAESLALCGPIDGPLEDSTTTFGSHASLICPTTSSECYAGLCGPASSGPIHHFDWGRPDLCTWARSGQWCWWCRGAAGSQPWALDTTPGTTRCFDPQGAHERGSPSASHQGGHQAQARPAGSCQLGGQAPGPSRGHEESGGCSAGHDCPRGWGGQWRTSRATCARGEALGFHSAHPRRRYERGRLVAGKCHGSECVAALVRKVSPTDNRISWAGRPPDSSGFSRFGRPGSCEPFRGKAPRAPFLLGLDRASEEQEVGRASADRFAVTAVGFSVHSFCSALSSSSALNSELVLAQHAVFPHSSTDHLGLVVLSTDGPMSCPSFRASASGRYPDFLAGSPTCPFVFSLQEYGGFLCGCVGGVEAYGLAPKRCIGGSGTSAKLTFNKGDAPYKPELHSWILPECSILLGAVLYVICCCGIIRTAWCAGAPLAPLLACVFLRLAGSCGLCSLLRFLGLSRVRVAEVWACGSCYCPAHPHPWAMHRLRDLVRGPWPENMCHRLLRGPRSIAFVGSRSLGLLLERACGSVPSPGLGFDWPACVALVLGVVLLGCRPQFLNDLVASPCFFDALQTHCLALGRSLCFALCLGLLGMLCSGSMRRRQAVSSSFAPCASLVVPLASCARPVGILAWRRGHPGVCRGICGRPDACFSRFFWLPMLRLGHAQGCRGGPY